MNLYGGTFKKAQTHNYERAFKLAKWLAVRCQALDHHFCDGPLFRTLQFAETIDVTQNKKKCFANNLGGPVQSYALRTDTMHKHF